MKHASKHCVALLGLLATFTTTTALADTTSDTPDRRAYDHVLSSSGPLTAKQLLASPAPTSTSINHSAKTTTVKVDSTLTVKAAAASSGNTYTYLRCYYRTSSNPAVPTTNYVWGLNPSGSYYEITGSWYGDAVIGNMFFSNTTQAALQSACTSTLKSKGINQTPAMVFAADNDLSFNYTVWTNDTSSATGAINRIVAFGDSLSDNQNLYNESDWLAPNSTSYYIGHFSNGYNWVDYLAQNLGLPVVNWAVGGAGVTTEDLVIPGLVEQVQSWQSYMTQAPNYNPANTLFTVFIGGNDLVNYDSNVATVLSGETTAIQTLINSGAKNILVMELPDVSKAPVFQIDTDAATVQAEVISLRSQLVAYVQGLQAQYGSALHIEIFDTYTLFNNVLANPSAYGVTNTTQSCLNITSDSSANYFESHSLRSGCNSSTVGGYMFWDLLHPTTHTHQVLGNAVSTFAQANFPSLP